MHTNRLKLSVAIAVLACGCLASTAEARRQYNPGLKRFVQRDPLASDARPGSGYQDGLSLFSYSGLSPAGRNDPTGQSLGGIIAAGCAASTPNPNTTGSEGYCILEENAPQGCDTMLCDSGGECKTFGARLIEAAIAQCCINLGCSGCCAAFTCSVDMNTATTNEMTCPPGYRGCTASVACSGYCMFGSD